MKRLFFYVFLFMAFVSCVTDTTEIDRLSQENTRSVVLSKTRTVEDGYTVLPNPYALEVMQQVYDTYSSRRVVLDETHLYVRFLPQDSLQLASLYDDYDLELFDFPLDIELEEGEEYIDSSIPEGGFTWQYTTVDYDFEFPEDIEYEILEECYIPYDDEEIIVTREGTTIDVEEAAFELMGYEIEDEVETRASKVHPEGTIRVFDNSPGVNDYVPVKGVKIRCHRIVKWSTTYTDEDGHYVMDSKFRFRTHYAIVFDNCKDFDIWGNWLNIAKANYNMGWHSKYGHSRDIDRGSEAWKWCAINNAGYDYYKMCEQTGILKPPAKLKVWAFPNAEKSAAPMLRRINHSIASNGNNHWANLFFNATLGITSDVTISVFRKLLPDITIGCNVSNYSSIYNAVNHEFAHASHFSRVGSSFWARYISYILLCFVNSESTYGDGNREDAQLCAVGEMWGYAMGEIQKREHYGEPLIDDNEELFDEWFKPEVFYYLYANGTLTKREIFNCLLSNVTSYDALVARMYALYPDKADAIENCFQINGITTNVVKPGDTGMLPDIIYDSYFQNQFIAEDYTYIGQSVYSSNVTVSNNATLVIQGSSAITIIGPFVVQRGSSLILQ